MKLASVAASLAMLLAITVVSGCSGCDAGRVGTLSPVFSIPEAHDFGSVLIGFPEVRSIAIANTGTARGTIQIELPTEPFVLLSPSIIDLAPGDEVDVVVQASPTSVGLFREDLVFILEGDAGSARELGTRRMPLFGDALAVPNCDDDNACTTEEFDAAARACVYRPREGACDDANACSQNDRCLVGVCVGEPIRCEDEVDCTVDGCHPLVGCTFVANDDLCDDGDRCSEDTCDREQGCRATPSPEGARCDDGVACAFANVCLGGICTPVPIPEGVTCDDEDPCTGASHCASGVCVAEPGVVGAAHSVTAERNFLPASWVQAGNIFGEKNRAVFASGFLYVIAKNALTVVDVWPHGFEVYRRMSAPVDAMVKLDETTLATFTRNGSVSIFDLEVPSEPILIRTLQLERNPTAVFVSESGGIGFCLGGNGAITSPEWTYFDQPRVASTVFYAVIDACIEPASLVGMGDRLVSSRFSSAGNTRTAHRFSGPLLSEVVDVSTEGNSTFAKAFRVGNLAAFLERTFQGVSSLSLVDDTTLAVTRAELPADIRHVLGANQSYVYVVNDANEFVTLEIGGVLTVAFPPFALPPQENVSLLAASDDTLLLREETYEESIHSISLWTLNLAENGAVVGKGADGFSTSVSGFSVQADQTLTVFGLGGVSRGDIASLRSAPVNPLARRAPASPNSKPMLAFDEGLFVGAFVLHRDQRTGLCTQCDFGLQWTRPRLPTTEFELGGDGVRQFLPINGLNDESPYLERASARGTRLAMFSRNENSVLYLDLTPVTGSGFPQVINEYTPALLPNFHATHIEVHADDLVTFVHGQVATLLDFATTPPTEIAVDANLSGGGISSGGSHTFLSAYATPEFWFTLTSGGASTGGLAVNPMLTVIARDQGGPGETSPPIRIELPSNAQSLQSQAGYRSRILGVENGLLYISHVRIVGDAHDSELLVYVLDALPTGPHEIIALSSEAVGMAILPDGGRLIGREDGFTFVYPECRE